MHYLGRALARLTVSKTQTSTCAEHGQRMRTYQSLTSDIPHASSVRVARSHCVLVGCPHRSQGCDRATRTNELRCAPFLSLSLFLWPCSDILEEIRLKVHVQRLSFSI